MKCSPCPQCLSCKLTNENSKGIIACSPPSPWECCGLRQNRSPTDIQIFVCRRCWQTEQLLRSLVGGLPTWLCENAVMVASGSSSKRPWRTCAMHSQPTFVVMTHWLPSPLPVPTVGTLSLPPTSEQHPQRRCPALHRLVMSTLSIFAIEPPRRKSAMIWRRPRGGASAP